MPHQPRKPRRPSGCPVEIVAHRGASAEAPENTLAAVELAWQLGADAVEIDVQLSRDGHLAVIHDPTLNRTAGIEGRVSDMLMSDLRNTDVGASKGEPWQGEMISALPDILATIPAGRRLYVELKGDDLSEAPPQMIDALQRDLAAASIAPDSVVVISFSAALLGAVREALPEFNSLLVVKQKPIRKPLATGQPVPTGQPIATAQAATSGELIIWDPPIDEIIDAAVSSGFDGVSLSNTDAVTPDAVLKIRRAQLKTCIWVVNSVDDAHRLADAGIDSLATADPRTIRAALSQPAAH